MAQPGSRADLREKARSPLTSTLARSENDMEDLKFKLEKAKNAPVSDEEILNDLRQVSCTLNSHNRGHITGVRVKLNA